MDPVWLSGSCVEGLRCCSAGDAGVVVTRPRGVELKGINMGYGIGGILITILVILAIIYFAKRV